MEEKKCLTAVPSKNPLLKMYRMGSGDPPYTLVVAVEKVGSPLCSYSCSFLDKIQEPMDGLRRRTQELRAHRSVLIAGVISSASGTSVAVIFVFYLKRVYRFHIEDTEEGRSISE